MGFFFFNRADIGLREEIAQSPRKGMKLLPKRVGDGGPLGTHEGIWVALRAQQRWKP